MAHFVAFLRKFQRLNIDHKDDILLKWMVSLATKKGLYNSTSIFETRMVIFKERS